MGVAANAVEPLVQSFAFRKVVGVVFIQWATRIRLQRCRLACLQISGPHLEWRIVIGRGGLELARLALAARDRYEDGEHRRAEDANAAATQRHTTYRLWLSYPEDRSSH